MNKVDEWPAFNVERRSVDALKPYDKNARTHSAEQIQQIAASIKEWGWTQPILIDEKSGVLAGHGRLEAAKSLGIAEVPVIVAAGWSKAQKRAYVLADNQLALNAGWDEDLLRVELGALKDEFDLALLGFDDLQLVTFLADKTAGLTDEDDVPPVPDRAVTQAGDIWVCGNHRLICGDSTDAETVAKVLAGIKPHLMVTDPPYGVEYDPSWRAVAGLNKNSGKMGKVLNDDRADWRDAWEKFPGEVAYVWCAPGPLQCQVHESLITSGFAVRQQIVWVKDRFALGRGNYHYQHEPCWYAVKSGKTAHWGGGRSQASIWSIPARESSGVGHSTQKPVECMRRPIVNNSSPGQAIYEPFCGSGTTMIAAEMEGRHAYCIELSEAYCDVIVSRWQAFTGHDAVLEGDGRTFEEVSNERNQSVNEAAE